MAESCPRGPDGERCLWKIEHHHAQHRAWLGDRWVTWQNIEAPCPACNVRDGHIPGCSPRNRRQAQRELDAVICFEELPCDSCQRPLQVSPVFQFRPCTKPGVVFCGAAGFGGDE